MVDLTRDRHRRVQARLLDLVPGRSGTVYADWLKTRSHDFRTGIRIAPLDPFAGYKNAIDAHLDEATFAPEVTSLKTSRFWTPAVCKASC